MHKSQVLAIDGPSGSGKSSLAIDLAERLGLNYIDTGSMFRSVAYIFQKLEIDLNCDESVKAGISSLNLNYRPWPDVLIASGTQVLDDFIRSEEISLLASKVSQLAQVRSFLLEFQRGLAEERFCVMEGRDIGTVVFPNAFLKFFITATPQERAKRRFKQLKERGDQSVSFEQVLEDVILRDKQDSERAIAPLKAAADAKIIDTTTMEYQEVLEHLYNYSKERLPG